jgi:hypothetical protein
MTYCDVFVGRLRSPDFDWSDASQELNSRDIEHLTKSFLDADAFNTVHARIRERAVPFRMLDWGSWVVPATKGEILDLMAKWKPGWDLPEPGDETDKPRLQRARCRDAVNALTPDGAYVLVIEVF